MKWKSNACAFHALHIFFVLFCILSHTISIADSEPITIVNYDHLFDTPSPVETYPRLPASSVNALKTESRSASPNRQRTTFSLDLDRIDRNVHYQFDSFGNLRGPSASKKKRSPYSSSAPHKYANVQAQKTSSNLRRLPKSTDESSPAATAAAAESVSSNLPSTLSSSSASSPSGSEHSRPCNSSPSSERIGATSKHSTDSEETSSFSSSGSAAPLSLQKRRRQCRYWKKQSQVFPGRSWGSLTAAQQDLWMNMQCNEFFCEPHSLTRNGVHACVPLAKGKVAITNKGEGSDRKEGGSLSNEAQISRTL